MSTADSIQESLAQLQQLALGLCQDSGVRLVLGDQWAWSPERRQIQVDRSTLASRPLEVCAGIVAHEVGHQLISRYLDFAEGQPERPLERFVLNAIEDARVEAFLPSRYPGVGPWLLAARQDDPFQENALVIQFLLAIACSSTLALGALPLAPEVLEALDRTAEVRERAVRGFLPSPDLVPPPGFQEDPSVQGHLVPEARGPRSPREAFLLQLTRGVLGEWRAILDAARSLLERDRQAGRVPDWTRLQAVLRRVPPLRESHADKGAPRAPAPGSYEEAWRKVASQADALASQLERLLLPRKRLGWRSGHAAGQRVDLRRAMQAEADPRQLQRVWARKTIPTRRATAFGLLVDLSGSMHRDGRIQATLAAVALFAETLARLGVPFRIDGFQDELIPLQDFAHPLDAAARHRLGEMPLEVEGTRPGGHNQYQYNDDGPCLQEAAERLLARPEQERILLVLCDGRPEGRRSNSADLEQAIEQVKSQITLIGLGLGPDTAHVARLYPIARAGLAVEELASQVDSLLQEHLLREPP